MGGSSGFAGAVAAHVLTILADRAGAESWLRGPYGPQFAPIAIYSAIFYASLGAAAGRRPLTALLGFLGPLLGIAATMTALTRYAGWGMPRGLPSTPQWQLAVASIYTVSIWSTTMLIGAASSQTARWRGALAAVLGSWTAYGLLTAFLWALPSYSAARWNPLSLLPSPINLMDGMLSGAGLCLALSLDSKIRSHA